MRVHVSHTLFKPEDFTAEEIERKNLLAVQVIDYKLKHCKTCGRVESDLRHACGSMRIRLGGIS